MSSASPTAPALPPAKPRARSNRRCSRSPRPNTGATPTTGWSCTGAMCARQRTRAARSASSPICAATRPRLPLPNRSPLAAAAPRGLAAPPLCSQSARTKRRPPASLGGAGAGHARKRLLFRLRLDVAGDLTAALDLDLAVANGARNAPARPNQKPFPDRQIAFEAAADLGLFDRSRALEQAGLGDVDIAAVGQIGLDAAFDDQLFARGDLARQADIAADDQLARLGVIAAPHRCGPRRLAGAERRARRLGSARRRCDGLAGGGRVRHRSGRPGRLHRDAQIILRIGHFRILCFGSFAAEHRFNIRSLWWKEGLTRQCRPESQDRPPAAYSSLRPWRMRYGSGVPACQSGRGPWQPPRRAVSVRPPSDNPCGQDIRLRQRKEEDSPGARQSRRKLRVKRPPETQIPVFAPPRGGAPAASHSRTAGGRGRGCPRRRGAPGLPGAESPLYSPHFPAEM